MSVGLISQSDWELFNNDFVNSKASMQANYTTSNASDQSVFSEQTQQTGVSSECSDGSDDGKIGLFSKIGSVLKGVANGAVNMVKGAISNPLKTAAVVAACCIPVVGPLVAGGLAAYGIYSGGKQILSGIEQANNATTDAEAKDAWENVGSGGLTVGVSAVGLKGSAGMLKSQLNGASTTVNAVKSAKSNGATKGQIAEITFKEGVRETGSTISGAYTKVKDKAVEIKDGGIQGVKDSLTTKANKAIDSTGAKIRKVVDKVDDFQKQNLTKEARALKKQTKAAQKSEVQAIKDNAKLDGGKITEKSSGFEVEYSDGTVMKYNNKGIQTSQSNTVVNSDGTTTTIVKKFDSQGTLVKRTTTVKNSQGEIISENGISKNLKTGVEKSKQVNIDADGNKTTTTTSTNHKTGVVYQDKVSKTTNGTNKSSQYASFETDGFVDAGNLSKIDKFFIKADSNSLGNIINWESKILKESTNPFFMTGSSILLEKEKEAI